jgi:hypothetical protein
VPQALQVILANAENGAVSVLLIHSNESILKAAAEQELLRQLPSDIVKTDMLTFAKFWRARDRLQWNLTAASVSTEAVLQVKSDESVTGLTFEFHRPIASVAGGASISPDNRHLVLPELAPGHAVSIHINYLH